ncbi:MAG: TIGR00730 family Rossman fold protein [Acidimicrobiales bacterium]
MFCGSTSGGHPEYRQAAETLGRRLAARGIGLVYGGAAVGLMGALADAALAAGGQVTGVLPRQMMDREIAHSGLTDLRVVGSMHERKALMTHLADGFVALPGGLGTFDELLECLTWSQLGLHDHPVGMLDVGGYFEPLVAAFDRAVEEGFVQARHRDAVIVGTDADEVLDRLQDLAPARP